MKKGNWFVVKVLGYVILGIAIANNQLKGTAIAYSLNHGKSIASKCLLLTSISSLRVRRRNRILFL